jgi:hypothetical protein
VAHFPSASVGALGDLLDTSANCLSSDLAWTIADLAGRDVPGRDELAIASAMRRGEEPGAVRREATGA